MGVLLLVESVRLIVWKTTDIIYYNSLRDELNKNQRT